MQGAGWRMGSAFVRRWRTPAAGLALVLALAALSGCQRAPAPPAAVAAAAAPAAPDTHSATVTLKPEEVRNLGVMTTPARAMTHAREVVGFGLVSTHEAVAQALLELVTATASERQSRAALERAQRLAGTPGAMPLDTMQTALRQATVDAAASALARAKLSASYGQGAPWSDRAPGPLLDQVANGTLKLVRATFPLGTLEGAQAPSSLRLVALDQSGPGEGVRTRTVWAAPADPGIPGSSFFALVARGPVREGERLLAYAPVGAPVPGAWIPAPALVLSEGKFWCYVQKAAGTFERRALDSRLPLDGGYFVTQGVSAGESVVTTAAGLLLAREMNPSAEAD